MLLNKSKGLLYWLHCALFLYFAGSAGAQIKNIGLPFISNFTREEYQAGTQNWSIAQDENGLMYFGNNSGLLRFDSYNWELFPLPNRSIVRIVNCIGKRVYVGGFDEFGYFSYEGNGKFLYTSLSSMLDEEFRNFDEIWRIYPTSFGIVFHSYKGIFLLSGEEICHIKPISQFGFSYLVDNNLLVVDKGNGLFMLQGKRLTPVMSDKQFFNENEVTFIFSTTNNNYLIGTINNGVYVYDGAALSPWKASVNSMLIKNQIFTATELGNDQMAIGTVQDGIFVIEKSGKVIQHINRYKGLQNNTILSIFHDHGKNLWLGLDNGIDFLEICAPVSILNYCYNIETVYTSIVHGGILYIGTNQGLFARSFDEVKNGNSLTPGFEKIKGAQGQVWTLEVIDSALICGHNFGTFQIKGHEAVQLSEIPGGWDYVKVPKRENMMVGGTYTGLVLFEKTKDPSGHWKFSHTIKGFNESARELAYDDDGNLWMSHGYKGLFKINLSEKLDKVDSYLVMGKENGLPEKPYSFTRVKGKFYIVASDGLYTYDGKHNKFILTEKPNTVVSGEVPLTKVVEDYSGDIWFFTTSGMGVYRLQEDGAYIPISIPFHRMKDLFLSNSFENIYSYNNQNVFIGGQRGMLHYNPEKHKQFDIAFKPFFNAIRIKYKGKDSTVYNAYGLWPMKDKEVKNTFSFKYNSISFHFTAPFYEGYKQTLYSYRLTGYDQQWSGWDTRKMKEFTNLYEGEYVFELKAKNIYGRESETARFSFTIMPPIYRSKVAYIVYFSLFFLVVVLTALYLKRKIEKIRRIEKIKHEKVLVKKEMMYQEEAKQSEAEIEKLKSEKLVSEMKHKNMELANATMHLIQKNKFLTKLKNDLMKMWGEAKVETVKNDIRQIVKKIDKDFKNEQQWKVFDSYFNEVHQDFIQRLKEKHAALTPNDLRLCAYLRMNLSTKEIAPLMNISVRGLEISRYRLRKKLDLNKDHNLTEYFMNI